MLTSKHAVVVDSNGDKLEFVLVDFIEQSDGEVKEDPQYYAMQENEHLIYDDVETANSMVKPRWDDQSQTWEETATPEEVEAAYEKVRSQFPGVSSESSEPSAPTNEQRLVALESAIFEMAGEIYG